MRLLLLVMLLALVAPLEARPLPVIDMHLHASLADQNGPPPLGLCVPMTAYLSPLDPGRRLETRRARIRSGQRRPIKR